MMSIGCKTSLLPATAFLVALSAISPAHVFAQGQQITREFDLNGDGMLDPDEFSKALTIIFQHRDRDGNGTLTRSEIFGKDKGEENMELWLTEARLSALDKNGDGVWTRQELLAPEQMRQLFISMDMNADRNISVDELTAGKLGGESLVKSTGK